jgi:DNA-binding CsgD family transcriptional regulator
MARRVDPDRLAKAAARLGDAAVDPAVWPDVMDEICEALATTGAVLFQSDVRTPDVPRTGPADEIIRAYFDHGWAGRDERATYGVPRLLAGEIVTDQDLFTREQMRKSPMYNDLIFAHGFQWFGCVGFWAGPAFWALAMQRAPGEGAFGERDKRLLARLAPRLTETATLSAAVGRAALSSVTNALNRVRQPAVVLHRLGFVLEVNAAAAAGFDDEIRVKDRHLVVRDKVAAGRLERLLQLMRFTPDTAALPAEPIVIRRAAKPPVLLRVLPVDGAARSVFLGARALLILGNLTPRVAPEPSVLSQAFGLTPAEARVASLLVEGRSVNAIARRLGVMPNTVRMQLKAVFAKTGVHRQAELVSLLALPS